MPLSCDCYGGCWGRHSTDWPKMTFCCENQARLAYVQCFDRLPYGSYVIVGKELRLEEPGMVAFISARLQDIDPKVSSLESELASLRKVAEAARRLVKELSNEYIADIAVNNGVTNGRVLEHWRNETRAALKDLDQHRPPKGTGE